MVGRLVVKDDKMRVRMERMGITNVNRIYTSDDLAPGDQIIFTACGVTPGSLLSGVRFFGEGYRTHSIVMTRTTSSVRFIDTVHMTRKPGPRGVRLY
jgi:fructose-1,6-bisphosphatase II